VYRLDEKTTRTFSMPETIADIVELLLLLWGEADGYTPVIYMEQLTGFTGRTNTGSSNFKMGKYYYPIETLCFAFDKRLVMVPPQRWMKALGTGTRSSYSDQTQWKNHLKEMAQRLYPEIKITLKVADSLLLLEYAKQCESRFSF